MKNLKWQLLLTGLCTAALAIGCDGTKDTADTGTTDGGAGPGTTAGPGDTTGGPGDTTGGPGDDTGTTGPGDTTGGGGDDTALAAVAFYMSNTIDPGSTGDMMISGEMTGEFGVVGYGVAGGYVEFDVFYCAWFASTSAAGLPDDSCDDCEFAFAMNYDTPTEEGDSCSVMSEGLGPYGYTGPEVFALELPVGFSKLGSSSYNGFEYDYGYVNFYYGYPYYYWATSANYSAFTYDNYYDAALTDFYAINGYYGIAFTP